MSELKRYIKFFSQLSDAGAGLRLPYGGLATLLSRLIKVELWTLRSACPWFVQ